MDKEKFFREATIQICNTLDIEKAVAGILRLLGDHLPADGLILSRHDFNKKQLHVMAQASTGKTRKLSTEFYMPDGYLQEILWQDQEKIKVINDPKSHGIARIITQALGREEISYMVMRLKIDEEKLGQLAIYSCRRNAYTDRDAYFFSQLHEPFAIAMSNAVKHLEVLQLNERLRDENRYLYREALHRSGDTIIGEGSGLRRVVEQVRQVAPMNSPVLLLGETGVGKEVIANAIHNASPRREGPFIKVNCGAIPDHLIDSELFGHEKGAFTGALSSKRGRFERADGGTILLDEIGELPLQGQVRLLRVLQSKEIDRVGGTRTLPVDVRVIAATHQDLDAMLQRRAFREDLFFRLNVFPILIPPLRNRQEDIPALVSHFIGRKMEAFGMRRRPFVTAETMGALQAYAWPGNIRELENRVERAMIQHRGGDENHSLDFAPLSNDAPKPRATEDAAQDIRLPKLNELIAGAIRKALEQAGGQIHGKNGAADLLGINPNTLRSKMRKLGIPFSGKKKNQ